MVDILEHNKLSHNLHIAEERIASRNIARGITMCTVIHPVGYGKVLTSG